MFKDFAELHRDRIVKDVIAMVQIPSYFQNPTAQYPYGEPVGKALELAAKMAAEMGFRAKNNGYCTEILYGGKEQKSPEKVYIASHLDVVPAGDGWSRDPWKASIRDGKIYGRGVLDDKGPAIAVLYALKALKCLGIEPKAEIRLILGGDEERGMEDLKRYVNENGLPDFGLTPDSSFPIVFAEAGVIFADFSFPEIRESGSVLLEELSGGRAYNCVADLCRSRLKTDPALTGEIKKILSQSDAEFSITGNTVFIQTVGISAHGSTPQAGKNAIFSMIRLLNRILEKTGSKNNYLEFAARYLVDDFCGEKLGIFSTDDIIGDMTMNLGMADYNRGQIPKLSIDLRLPIQADEKQIYNQLSATAQKENAAFTIEKADKSTYMPKEDPRLQKLAEIYQKITGKTAAFLSCRGATYAKAFDSRGVAVGPIDENDHSQGGGHHGADEYISIEALLNLTAIYAEAIYRLFC